MDKVIDLTNKVVALEEFCQSLEEDNADLEVNNAILTNELSKYSIYKDKYDTGNEDDYKLLDLNNQCGPDGEPYNWKKDTRFQKTLSFLAGTWCGGEWCGCTVCERYMKIYMHAFNKIESLSGRTFVEFCDPQCYDDVRGSNAKSYDELIESGKEVAALLVKNTASKNKWRDLYENNKSSNAIMLKEIGKLQEHIDVLENNPFRRIYNAIIGIFKYRIKLVKVKGNNNE